MKTSEAVPVAAGHAKAITPLSPCFTDKLMCFGSLRVPALLQICSLHHSDIINPGFICPQNLFSKTLVVLLITSCKL